MAEGSGAREHGRRATQPAEPTIVPGEEFTHGGVRKTKFEPKVPTRRLKKLQPVKGESGENGEAELPKELQRLIQQSEKDDAKGSHRPDRRGPARVAFGFGSAAARGYAPSAGFHHPGGGGGGRGAGGGGGYGARGAEKKEFLQGDPYGEFGDSKKGVRKNVEVFDHSRYFPVSLPLRKPMSGSASLLDDEEFEEDAPHDEDAITPADELDLNEKTEEDRLFFLQVPASLPQLASTAGEDKDSRDVDKVAVKLENLLKGCMGKLLVYESGAVKLQLGHVILDMLPGTDCMFAQELAAVNTTSKHCCFLGDVNKRIVLTPDFNNLLSGS